MNLKLEDLSHYLVLLIFILVIIKVLGSGLYSKTIEFMGGHKPSTDSELDDLISKKKHQMVFQNLSPNASNGEGSLKEKIENSTQPQKEDLLEILKNIQWGEYSEAYTLKPSQLLEDISTTNGLPIVLEYFFGETLKASTKDIKEKWIQLAEKSILWTNLLNQTKYNSSIGEICKYNSLRSLALISLEDQDEVISLSLENLRALLEQLYQPLNIEKLSFDGSSFLDVETEEIFHLWQKNAHIFKSLEPIVPTSLKTTKNTTKEVLDLSSDEDSNEKSKSEEVKDKVT